MPDPPTMDRFLPTPDKDRLGRGLTHVRAKSGTGHLLAPPCPAHSYIVLFYYHFILFIISYYAMCFIFPSPTASISNFTLVTLNSFWIEKIYICTEEYYVLILVMEIHLIF